MDVVAETLPEQASNREDELTAAFARGEFTYHYQPQFDLRTRQVVAYEALLRWNRPPRDPMLPSGFLRDMEASELILHVGAAGMDWALERLTSLGPTSLRMALNLSPLQWRPGLQRRVERALDRHRLPGKALELEVTERVASLDDPRMLAEIRALREQGVRIALDDFGTGFASLAHLEALEVDTLKLDRRFIANTSKSSRSRAIVHAVLELARRMDLDVVAEGVETPEQLRFLYDAGCERAQGFLLGRPTPSPERFLAGPDCWW